MRAATLVEMTLDLWQQMIEIVRGWQMLYEAQLSWGDLESTSSKAAMGALEKASS